MRVLQTPAASDAYIGDKMTLRTGCGSRKESLMRCASSFVVLGMLGCTGFVGVQNEGKAPEAPAKPDDSSCSARLADDAPMRLLTRLQYNNTVADLLGDRSAPMTLEPGAGGDAFDTFADPLVADERLVEFYVGESTNVARRAVEAGLDTQCPTSITDQACAEAFIRTWGRRLFRRPPSEQEAGLLLRLHQKLRSTPVGDSAGQAFQGLLAAMLQMPAFLYRVEAGEAPVDGVAKLTGYELATRLAFFLWSSSPDDVLLDAAAADQLGTIEEVKAQATRMLASPKSRATAAHFNGQWLQINRLEGLTRDTVLYPNYGPALASAMRESTLRFLEDVMWRPQGRVADLYTSDRAFVNSTLAKVYGMKDTFDAGFVSAAVQSTQRSGLLTHPSVLTAYAKSNSSSPIARGVFINRRLMCVHLDDPPPNVQPLPEKIPEGTSLRNQLEAHTKNPCAGCHKMIDPAGLSLENYDAIGQYRTQDEAGIAIDASGGLPTSNGLVAVTNGIEVSTALAQSPQAAECVVRQWYRFALARGPDHPQDSCAIKRISSELAPRGFPLQEVLSSIVTSEVFRYRIAQTAGVCP